MHRWRRVGPTPGHVVGSFVFGAAGAVATLGLLYVLTTGSGGVGVTGAVLFLAACTVLAFRFGLVGLFVGDTGVRNRSMWATQTVAWPEIRRFETRPGTEGTHAVWVLLKDHSALRTSLTYRDKPSPGFFASTGTAEGVQRALRELRAAQEARGPRE